uniref:Uncharacterized protein n=2 Tax=Palpitomonas bilix TaxID=652834 RepID=A0A7S3GIY6_9EUKA|mmetsp:Transcript_5646/g.13174  ORF Transcript_5646/g.13174 Transcript_5646/m.13174 type:complete len:125 (+) Transcript_5646:142-516(+)
MGDPVRLLLCKSILDVIKQEKLLELTAKTGEKMNAGLLSLQDLYPQLLSSARGQGTYCAIDVASQEARDAFVQDMRVNGVLALGSGVQSIRFRPGLIFGSRHVDILLEKMEGSAKVVSAKFGLV